MNGLKDYIPVFFTELYVNDSKIYPLSLIFTFICAFVVTLGTEKSDKTNQFICIAKLCIVCFIIIVGFTKFDSKYF